MLCQLLVIAASVCLSLLTQFEVDTDVLVVEKNVSLPVSRNVAFKTLADIKNMPKWYPGTISFEPVDGTPMDIGKHFTEIHARPGIGNGKYDIAINGFESPRYIGYVSDAWTLPRVEITLENTNLPYYPTVLTWKIHSRRRSYLFKYLVSPVLRYVQGQRLRHALFNILFSFHDGRNLMTYTEAVEDS